MDSLILVIIVAALSVQFCTAQSPQDVCKGVSNNNFVANPEDCSSFYICVDEIGRVENCPAGTKFDYLKGYCSFDDEVACKKMEEVTETTVADSSEMAPITTTTERLTTAVSTSVPTTVTTSKQTTELTESTEATETTTIASNSNAKEFCKTADPNVLNFLPSTTNCEQYFICMNGEPFQLQCASGSHWNDQRQFCDDPKMANCQVNPPNVDDLECPSRGSAFFPHPKICEFYFSCDQGKMTLQRCPFYYQWDTSKETCVMKHLARCDKATISQYRWT
ncbi:probable endochitinase [Toxorhynchites rutilus septentrionalis]|uniref:probable endochitinase n=1 Tax=Toxorhynchites rutilus septentrionalis TaxID=329112 RepID=UPI00247A0D11|nr:probable endochitinase [Toxorhynchites rutilus septentrionalis]